MTANDERRVWARRDSEMRSEQVEVGVFVECQSVGWLVGGKEEKGF